MTPKQNYLVTVVYWCCIGIVLCFLAVILRDGCRGILCKGTDALHTKNNYRGVIQWKKVGPISRKSLVRIQPPQLKIYLTVPNKGLY